MYKVALSDQAPKYSTTYSQSVQFSVKFEAGPHLVGEEEGVGVNIFFHRGPNSLLAALSRKHKQQVNDQTYSQKNNKPAFTMNKLKNFVTKTEFVYQIVFYSETRN